MESTNGAIYDTQRINITNGTKQKEAIDYKIMVEAMEQKHFSGSYGIQNFGGSCGT